MCFRSTMGPELTEKAFYLVNQLTQSRGVEFTKPNMFQEHLWPGLTKKAFSLGG